MKNKVSLIFTPLIILLLMTGCSTEKAEALVTAVKSFESKSLQAIDSYEQLFKDYIKQERETDDELFTQTSDSIIKNGKPSVTKDTMVASISIRENSKNDNTIENEFYDIKLIYALLRNSYESLPQGNLLGAEYVACGQDIVAKATSQLVNFSVTLNKKPLYPLSINQKVADYKNLVANKKDTEARLLFNEISTAIKAYDEKHEQTIKLTLAAVEDGRNLHTLLGNYSSASVSDILAVVQFGLDFLGTLNGIDVNHATSKLESIQKELGDKEYWKRIEKISISNIEQCNMNLSITPKDI
ncbi:hypothetical protein [Photobacterium lipolyticum]|uniref:Lipoprotein n=1 Tax=Photobacterium lipolyticum TaxID=266810 RepID=A0A2T3N081_9GAMM|nr:hypothetical protein [Photobacterium lipolyticum]PSW05651.1 hypothetical protein C9I89_07835 [Photobacterium lipolyticum]